MACEKIGYWGEMMEKFDEFSDDAFQKDVQKTSTSLSSLTLTYYFSED